MKTLLFALIMMAGTLSANDAIKVGDVQGTVFISGVDFQENVIIVHSGGRVVFGLKKGIEAVIILDEKNKIDSVIRKYYEWKKTCDDNDVDSVNKKISVSSVCGFAKKDDKVEIATIKYTFARHSKNNTELAVSVGEDIEKGIPPITIFFNEEEVEALKTAISDKNIKEVREKEAENKKNQELLK